MEEYGKIKKEFEQFKKIRSDLGLESSDLIDIDKMKKNLGIKDNKKQEI